MRENVIEANRQRTLILTDGEHVYYVPEGWADGFTYAAGCTGGPDWQEGDEDMADGPGLYCYAALNTDPNSPVETLFVSVAVLQGMKEISEEEARQLHPALFEYLAAIDEQPQTRKYLVSVDVHVVRQMEYEVEATSPEEADDLVRDGQGQAVDPGDADACGDDYDVRYVTDPATGDEWEF
jgi:hypothetical protein